MKGKGVFKFTLEVSLPSFLSATEYFKGNEVLN